MIRGIILGIGLLTLASCGVDGPPVRPSVGASVNVGSGGSVYSNVGVGVSSGPLSIFLGL